MSMPISLSWSKTCADGAARRGTKNTTVKSLERVPDEISECSTCLTGLSQAQGRGQRQNARLLGCFSAGVDAEDAASSILPGAVGAIDEDIDLMQAEDSSGSALLAGGQDNSLMGMESMTSSGGPLQDELRTLMQEMGGSESSLQARSQQRLQDDGMMPMPTNNSSGSGRLNGGWRRALEDVMSMRPSTSFVMVQSAVGQLCASDELLVLQSGGSFESVFPSEPPRNRLSQERRVAPGPAQASFASTGCSGPEGPRHALERHGNRSGVPARPTFYFRSLLCQKPKAGPQGRPQPFVHNAPWLSEEDCLPPLLPSTASQGAARDTMQHQAITTRRPSGSWFVEC